MHVSCRDDSPACASTLCDHAALSSSARPPNSAAVDFLISPSRHVFSVSLPQAASFVLNIIQSQSFTTFPDLDSKLSAFS